MTWRRRTTIGARWIVLMLVMGAAHIAHAQDSTRDTTAIDPRAALPERPTVATHAYTVAPAYAEVETGIQVSNPSNGGTLQTPTLLKIGIVPHLQFDISSAYTRTRTGQNIVHGINDLALGFKWHALSDVPMLGDFAVQSSVTLPTASSQTVGTGTTEISLLAIVSHQWGATELDVNAGMTHAAGNGTRVPRTATLWTSSLAFPVIGHLAWAAEIFGYPGTSGPAGAPPSVGILLGPTYAVQRYLVLDMGAIFNAEHLSGNSAYAGLTLNLGHL